MNNLRHIQLPHESMLPCEQTQIFPLIILHNGHPLTMPTVHYWIGTIHFAYYKSPNFRDTQLFHINWHMRQHTR